MDEDMKKAIRRRQKKNEALFAELMGRTDDGNAKRQEKMKPVIRLLEKELGDNAEYIIGDDEEMDNLLELSGSDRIQRVIELKTKLNKLHATPGPNDPPVVEESPEAKKAREKQEAIEAKYKMRSEIAGKKQLHRAKEIERLKKEIKDPDQLEDAIDELDRDLLKSEEAEEKDKE